MSMVTDKNTAGKQPVLDVATYVFGYVLGLITGASAAVVTLGVL